MADDELQRIIGIVREIGSIPRDLGPDEDFYDAGMSSIQLLPLIMELEDSFSVELGESMNDKIRTPRAVHGLIESLRAGSQPT